MNEGKKEEMEIERYKKEKVERKIMRRKEGRKEG